MTTGKNGKFWTLIIIILLAIIAVGSIVTWARYSPGKPLEISLAPEPEFQGDIYVAGEVNNPGFYPFRADDSIADVIGAAGGAIDDIDDTQFKLYIAGTETEQPQKIDINRAESWLLEALPGIGETRARAIIAYRQQNGRFNNINELLKVEGIGPAIYEKIENLITVAD